MIITEYIPIERFNTFHEILVKTNGRYLRNPIVLFSSVEVHYEPGDYSSMREALQRSETNIVEIDKRTFAVRCFRKLKSLFK
jgi:hypothetical protein